MGYERCVYRKVSGYGPYHDEEDVTLEQIEEHKYCIHKQIIAPMAGCYDYYYTFDASISLDEFREGLCESGCGFLEYEKIWKEIVMRG